MPSENSVSLTKPTYRRYLCTGLSHDLSSILPAAHGHGEIPGAFEGGGGADWSEGCPALGADAVRNWSIMTCGGLILAYRITGALNDWTSRYPGDLLEGQTLAIFREVLKILTKHALMAQLIADLSRTERSLVNVCDVDMSWTLQAIKDVPMGLLVSTNKSQIATSGESLGAGEGEANLVRTEFNAPVATDNPPSSVQKSTSSLNGSTDASLHSERKGSDGGSLSNDQPTQRRKQEKMGDDSVRSGWTEATAYILGHDPQMVAMNLVRIQWETFRVVRVSKYRELS